MLTTYRHIMPGQTKTSKGSRPATSARRPAPVDFEAVFRSSDVATCILDVHGCILSANPAAENLLDCAPDSPAGRTFADCIAPDDSRRTDFETLIRNATALSRSQTVECRFRCRDGGTRSAAVTLQPLPGSPKHLAVTCALIPDTGAHVHDHHQPAPVLQPGEPCFQAIAESTPDAVIVFSGHGKIVFWNKGARRLFGYAPEEILGRPPWVLWPISRREEQAAVLRHSFATRTSEFDGRISEDTALRRDGSEFPAEVSLTILEEQGQAFFSAIIRDISERKKAEAEMARLISAIDQASETVMLIDADGSILYINPAVTSMLGFAPDEVIGKNPFRLERGAYPSSFYQHIWETISGGSVWSGQMENVRKDGSIFTFETTISPVRDQHGAIISYVSIGRDISAELQFERRLRQAQKMESVGTLAGGIAHDFNNILAAIMGYTELTLSRLDDPAAVEKNLVRVMSAATRAKDLVNQILTFSRQSEAKKHPVRVDSVVRDTLKMLRAVIPATVTVTTSATTATRVLADEIHIQQILMNLATNAAHAMRRSGGVLDISLHDIVLDAEQAFLYQNLSPGAFLELTVQDTGTGIDPAVIDRIFDPFFTTKKVGEGTGMGLPMVHGIVESCDGAITVTSTPGAGTTITILLPAISGTAPRLETVAASPPPRGSGTVLLVEDEESLLDVGRQMLETLGYTVAARQSSSEALKAFHAAPGDFDLVMTDYTMPGMNGYDMAKKMLAIRRDIPIVLCTGYSENISRETARAAGIQEFLMKPCSLRQVAETVRRLLDTVQSQARG